MGDDLSFKAESSDIFEFLMDVRRIISEELPVYDNMISLDIVLLILASHFSGNYIQIKSLTSSLPHSKTGISYSCKKLLEDGWILKTNNGADGRVKHLVPTQKLMERCSAFIEKLIRLAEVSNIRY